VAIVIRGTRKPKSANGIAVRGRPVVAAPVAIVTTAVMTKYVVRAIAISVVQMLIQVLIAAELMKLAVKVFVVLRTNAVIMASAMIL